MSTYLRILLFILISNSLAFAQKIYQDEVDNSLVSKFKVDFAVPDLPAFKLLGTEPSSLLRPSTPEILSVITSNFFNGSNLVIPQSFAAEISPLLLLNANNLTLQEYDKNAILYSLRLSIGTMRNESTNDPGHLSLGLRVSLIDQGDLKNDKAYRKELYQITSDLVDLDKLYEDEFYRLKDWLPDDVFNDPEKREEMEVYVQNKKNEYINNAWGESLDERLSRLKKEYKTNNWNKQKMDVAYAILGVSPDSLLTKLKFSKHSFWLTYSHPISSWGQWLIGGNLSILSDSTSYFSFSLASRVYFGTNRIKGFLEVQYQRDDLVESNNLLLNLGTELNLVDGIWINFYAGVESLNFANDDKKSEINSHFDLRFTIPENFDLF